MVLEQMDSNLALAMPDQRDDSSAPECVAVAAAALPREIHLGPARLGAERPLGLLTLALRITFGVAVYTVCAIIVLVALLVCLPSRKVRIQIGNLTGHFTGRLAALLTGSSFRVRGAEHLDPARPAIYVANHTSTLDIVLGIWLAPVGTCGVAKKEIVLYPFFGQYYWLSGHLRIDRKNARRALRSLRELAALVAHYSLSVFIWPEGSRSQDGRLRPFKRGAFHLALETKLPIVPIVIAGSHRAWPQGTARLVRANVDVTCLPPIDTAGWTADTLGKHVREIEALFAATLPEAQRPLKTVS